MRSGYELSAKEMKVTMSVHRASAEQVKGTRPAGPTRREFMKVSGVALAALAAPSAAEASGHAALDEDREGVLVDLTVCVGCRRCEWACKNAHGQKAGALHEYDDQSVFAERRRPTPDSFTVVNREGEVEEDGRCNGKGPIHLKIQCMHCERPACVSACLVGAMQKDPHGPVFYDASRCIGCRYCMMACPFERLSYEYDSKLTPRVAKCDLCMDRTREGKLPACVEMCPVEALTYGRRSELLKIAHQRIQDHPDRYVDHIYGEHEVGGTSWLYLADRPFEELGFPRLGDKAPSATTEAIQHGIFRGFAAPIGLAALLGTINAVTKRRAER